MASTGSVSGSLRAGRRTAVMAAILVTAAATTAAGAIPAGASASTSDRAGSVASQAAADRSAAKTSKGTLPAAPTNVHITKVGAGVVELAWTPSADDGGRPIRVYRMVELNSGLTKMATGDVDVDGLMHGRFKKLPAMVPVRFAVMARSKVGNSALSDETAEVVPFPDLWIVPWKLSEGGSDDAHTMGIMTKTTLDVPIEIRVRTLADESGATVGVDYEPIDTVVTLPAKTASVPVVLPIIDDDRVEGNELVRVEISVVGIEESPVVRDVRIKDDDRGRA